MRCSTAGSRSPRPRPSRCVAAAAAAVRIDALTSAARVRLLRPRYGTQVAVSQQIAEFQQACRLKKAVAKIMSKGLSQASPAAFSAPERPDRRPRLAVRRRTVRSFWPCSSSTT
jgi:hypothetical protein